MRFILPLLLSSAAIAQTAAIPQMPVPIPPRLIPAQPMTITIPAGCNGCKVSFVIPAQTVPAQTLFTPSIIAPVSIGTITLNFSCTGPDLQHLSCKAQQQ